MQIILRFLLFSFFFLRISEKSSTFVAACVKARVTACSALVEHSALRYALPKD